jgi:serine/threonine-protein kinase
MATVYFGRLMGAVGFSRSVAIKQLHPQYARSPEFVAQFLDEARLTARVRHPNVVPVLDVVARDGELFVIMEYVEGEPLSRLMRASQSKIPIPIASAIVIQALLGLHAAHDATADNGMALEIVHRDVSPQNILVGVDGTSHILDFGVAKASSRVHTTENGQIKGKLAYMAPEQLKNEELDRRVDIFAMGIVLWELLAGQRLFARNEPGAIVAAVLTGDVRPPNELRPEISADLSAVVMKALAPERNDRFATARDLALAIENAAEPASALKTGAWVESVAKESIARRASLLREAEEESSVSKVMDPESLQRSLARAGNSAAPTSVPPAAVTEHDTTMPPVVARKARARALWLASAAAGLGVLAVLLFKLLSNDHQPLAKAVPPPAGSLAPGPNSAPAAAVPTTLPQVSVPLSAEPLPQLEAPAKPSPSAVKRTSVKPHVVSSKCNPPFVLDAQGHKRFKPECF